MLLSKRIGESPRYQELDAEKPCHAGHGDFEQNKGETRTSEVASERHVRWRLRGVLYCPIREE